MNAEESRRRQSGGALTYLEAEALARQLAAQQVAANPPAPVIEREYTPASDFSAVMLVQAREAYAGKHDRRATGIRVNRALYEALRFKYRTPDLPALFGLRIQVDDDLPAGAWELGDWAVMTAPVEGGTNATQD